MQKNYFYIINNIFNNMVTCVSYSFSTINLTIKDKELLTKILYVLKNSSIFRFLTLVDLVVLDSPEDSKRFSIIYILLSTEYNIRLNLKLKLGVKDLTLSSSTKIYLNSNWAEREAHEMFGVYFLNNPDLRRLLTDYGFEGFPLRKDFPLTGYVEVRYDEEVSSVVYEPVELAQEYRVFLSSSPWEGHQE